MVGGFGYLGLDLIRVNQLFPFHSLVRFVREPPIIICTEWSIIRAIVPFQVCLFECQLRMCCTYHEGIEHTCGIASLPCDQGLRWGPTQVHE